MPGFGQMASRLDQLAKLDENWDSYGALPTNAKTIERAKKFAMALTTHPDIHICNDGRISFSWLDEEVEVVISATGSNVIIENDLKLGHTVPTRNGA